MGERMTVDAQRVCPDHGNLIAYLFCTRSKGIGHVQLKVVRGVTRSRIRSLPESVDQALGVMSRLRRRAARGVCLPLVAKASQEARHRGCGSSGRQRYSPLLSSISADFCSLFEYFRCRQVVIIAIIVIVSLRRSFIFITCIRGTELPLWYGPLLARAPVRQG